eukprot:TRINITY_DN9143_c1_g2_i1.p4 TRINITY_DN9143_c1_g2~~TRINITY_DN9143_c1_g2_i1.p4  ORF type:complete len:216 (+),score=-22.61 TRINITY_DN9143_c1_g2_i1:1536-2183(+)
MHIFLRLNFCLKLTTKNTPCLYMHAYTVYIFMHLQDFDRGNETYMHMHAQYSYDRYICMHLKFVKEYICCRISSSSNTNLFDIFRTYKGDIRLSFRKRLIYMYVHIQNNMHAYIDCRVYVCMHVSNMLCIYMLAYAECRIYICMHYQIYIRILGSRKLNYTSLCLLDNFQYIYIQQYACMFPMQCLYMHACIGFIEYICMHYKIYKGISGFRINS